MQQSINGAVKAFMTFISYAENFFSKCHISILSEMESGKPAPITHYKCHELLLNKVVTIVITQKAYQTDCQSHNKCGKTFFQGLHSYHYSKKLWLLWLLLSLVATFHNVWRIWLLFGFMATLGYFLLGEILVRLTAFFALTKLFLLLCLPHYKESQQENKMVLI